VNANKTKIKKKKKSTTTNNNNNNNTKLKKTHIKKQNQETIKDNLLKKD